MRNKQKIPSRLLEFRESGLERENCFPKGTKFPLEWRVSFSNYLGRVR